MIKLFKSIVVFSILGFGLFVQSCDNQDTSTISTDASSDTITKEVVSTPDEIKVDDTSEKVVMPENFSLAYVDIDTLMEYYQFYIDASAEMKAYEERVKREYENKGLKLKQDYEAYVSKGKAGLLTLQQQKDTEARLQAQQEEFMALEQRIGQEATMKRQEAVNKVTETIHEFLNTYRQEKGYTIILQYGSMSGLLSASKELDITNDVLKRLNAKYQFDKKH